MKIAKVVIVWAILLVLFIFFVGHAQKDNEITKGIGTIRIQISDDVNSGSLAPNSYTFSNVEIIEHGESFLVFVSNGIEYRLYGNFVAMYMSL